MSSVKRTFASGLLALALLPIVAITQPAPVHAAAALAVTKGAPRQVLAGDPIVYTLTAENIGDEPLYNLSFRDVLPLGVTYTGPTSPSTAGEPQIIEVQVPSGGSGTLTQQTLVWSNVADVQVGDEFEIEFGVTANETADPTRPNLAAYVVGDSVDNTGAGYASPNPRVLPRFSNSTGLPLPNPFVVNDASAEVTTQITAIDVRKSEGSPEGELLRGVHDFVTTYTLDVEVTDRGNVDGVVVEDYLPAALEFLGCGGVDNSTLAPEEYSGSGPLGVFAPPVGCVEPDAVETVQNPTVNGTVRAGVFTKVTWNLGLRPAGSTISLPYAAGIPLTANTMTFPAPTPTPDSLGQTANLDNNVGGASTRELTSEGSVTNYATAGGTYSGAITPGGSAFVTDEDELTRSIEDLRIIKSASRSTFLSGSVVQYSIAVDTSEYVSATGVQLTDLVPNGLCPLGFGPYGGNEVACDALVPAPSPDYATITPTPISGGWTVVFEPLAPLPAGGSTTVTYSAFMRDSYQGGPNNGDSTVSGDTFTNHVSAVGQTDPIDETSETGPQEVLDESEWTLVTSSLALDKQIRFRDAPRLAPGADCPTDPAQYGESADVPDAERPDTLYYRLGDELCFRLHVDFDDTARTRNPVVTDFIPPGTEFVADSIVETPLNSVATELETPVGPDGPIVWRLGTVDVPGGPRFAGLDSQFDVVFKVRVVDVPDSTSLDVSGNLMKLRTENTAGRAQSFRDQEDFWIVPPPVVDLEKGVASVDTPPNGPNGPNVDGVQVSEGSVVTFRIDISNDGTAASFNDYSVRGLDVWDVLPAGITCAQISGITNMIDDTGTGPVYGACTDPDDGAAHPTFEDRATLSAIRWRFPVDPADVPGGVDRWGIVAGATRTVTYQMTIPTPTSAGVTLLNTAAVRSFDAFTNVQDDTAAYFPANNIDTTVPPADETAPEASDSSNVRTPGVAVDKVGVTSITDLPGNNEPDQAVPGETVTYRYWVDVPPAISIFEGELTDRVPTELELLTTPAPVARFFPDAAAPGTAPLPVGEDADGDPQPFAVSASGALTFPVVYTNGTATTQRFLVEVVARVRNDFSDQRSLQNVASFTSNDSIGGRPVNAPDASYDVDVLHPRPVLVKTGSPTVVVGGELVTYTLDASVAPGSPPLRDTWLLDCIPDGLAFESYGLTTFPTLAATDGDGTNGCPADTTRIGWALDRLASNDAQTLSYTARVEDEPVAGVRYTNTAELFGTSLDDGTANADTDNPMTPPNPLEREYSDTAAFDVDVPPGDIFKSVSPNRATIGQRVTYTFSATVPPNVAFFRAAAIDTVPPGLDADSIQFIDATCVPSPCGLSAAPMDETVEPGDGSTQIGFYIGDVSAAPDERTIVIRYSAVVADVPANIAGAVVRNSALTAWNQSDTGAVPTSPDYDWQAEDDEPAVAPLTVIEPRVQVTKDVSNATPEPNELFTYSIQLRNLPDPNRSDAYNLQLSDTIPVGVRVVPGSFSVAPATFTQSTTTVAGSATWGPSELPGPLAPGDSITITYLARLAPSAGITATPYVNTANLVSYRSLAVGGRTYTGNTDPATVTPQFPRLDTDKQAVDGEPTYLGTQYTWRVTVTNNGNGTANGANIVDTLPPGWAYVPLSAQVTFPDTSVEPREPALSPAVDPTTATWSALGELAPGESVVVTFRTIPVVPDVLTDPGIGSTIRQNNTAIGGGFDQTGASGNAAGPYGSDPATASTRIDAVDLVMNKSHTDTPVAGANFRWFLDVTNSSATDTGAGPFTVTDTLPVGVDYATAAGTGWACGYAPLTRTVTCTRGGTIPPSGALPRITVTVAIPSTVPAGTGYSNTASVVGRTYELDPPDNSDTDAITVTTAADLAIAKGRTTDPIVAGLPVTYTLDVSNIGPSVSRASASTPITVTDDVPAQTTFVSASGTDWDCGHSAGTITCRRVTDLPVGPAPQITVTVLAGSNATGTIANTGVVTPGPTTDPDDGNNDDTDTGPVTTSADVRIDKSSTTDPVPGATFVYRLRVDNDGPSDAQDVQIADDLPAGLTYQSAAAVRGDWTCDPSVDSTSFTCDLVDPLANDDWAIVDVTVFVDADVLDAIVNTAVVGSSTPDPDGSNNDDDDDSTFVGSADLTIDKTGAPAAVAGTAYEWTIVVTNNGPSDSVGTLAQPITVTDVLPDTVHYDSTSAPGWTCSYTGPPSQNGGTVTCELVGTIAGTPAPPALPTPSSTPPIVIDVTILDDAGPATIVNPVSVDSGVTDDPDPGNNDDTHEVVLSDFVDMRIDKTADPDQLDAGETTTFTIVVTNDGPSLADSVSVTDTLPAGMTVASVVAAAPWACPFEPGDTSVTCTRPSMEPGTGPDIVVTAVVDSAVAPDSTLVNTATVATTTLESDLDNNDDDAAVLVDTLADLGITKSHDVNPAVAGTDLDFALVVTNLGPSDATNPVVVTDTLPPGFSYVSNTGPWACVADPQPADPAASQVVTCTYTVAGVPAPLPAGAVADPIAMTVAIGQSVEPTGNEPYVNEASVSSPTPDDNDANDAASDPVDVVASADLAIAKSHPAPDVRVGNTLSFTLQVVNGGPSTAHDVTVSDTIPAGLTYQSVSAPGWSCDTSSAPAIDCALDDPLLVGSAPPIIVTVVVTAGAYPTVDNTATVASTTPDPVDSNNTSVDAVDVPPLVDLAITKSHDPGAIRVGGRTSYTLRVTNNGPTADPGPITITDTLPTGLVPVAATGAEMNCTITGSTVTCTSTSALAVGASLIVALTVDVEAAAYPSVTNTASVATPSEESSLTNNSSTTIDPVQPLVALELTKSLEVQLGEAVTWSFLLTNRGPNATVDPIVVTDPLPAGLTYVGASGDGWSCEAAANVVTCTYAASLAVGATAPKLVIATTVSASAGSTIVNTASASGGGPETPAVTSQATVTTPSGSLPITGGDPAMLGRLALLVGLLGVGLWLAARRRRPTSI